MRKNIVYFFHACIIASFLLSFSGCGYKADPMYVNEQEQQPSNQ